VVAAVLNTIAAVTSRLAAAGCVAAEEEAMEIIAAAPDGPTLETFVARRERGEPLAWITGTAEFCGHHLRIDAGVYIPRRQTEELARRAATHLAARKRGAWAVDLCTGSGAIALVLKTSVPQARVIGVDSDLQAVRCADRNGVPVVVGDLGESLARGTFDVVTAVAPYVPTGELQFLPRDVQRFEPRHALDGGSDGLDLVRRIVASAAELLQPGGWFLTELGGDQDQVLAPVLDANGFGSIGTWRDEEGDLRGVVARLSTSNHVQSES
jgi:release factor glutamine methyltransferase